MAFLVDFHSAFFRKPAKENVSGLTPRTSRCAFRVDLHHDLGVAYACGEILKASRPPSRSRRTPPPAAVSRSMKLRAARARSEKDSPRRLARATAAARSSSVTRTSGSVNVARFSARGRGPRMLVFVRSRRTSAQCRALSAERKTFEVVLTGAAEPSTGRPTLQVPSLRAQTVHPGRVHVETPSTTPWSHPGGRKMRSTRSMTTSRVKSALASRKWVLVPTRHTQPVGWSMRVRRSPSEPRTAVLAPW